MGSWPPRYVKVLVVSAIQHEQHDRPRAGIERHVVADTVAGMTVDRQAQSALLNCLHPDAC